MFDFVVVDFPDPNNYGVGKLYTTAFYRLLSRHLTRDGLVVVQATSPLFARQIYWCIAETMKQAGLRTYPYHVYVPSFGEWGFVLAAPTTPLRAAHDAPRRPALPHRRRRAAHVRVPGRHAARAGEAEPAEQSGARALLRAGVGPGESVSRRP